MSVMWDGLAGTATCLFVPQCASLELASIKTYVIVSRDG